MFDQHSKLEPKVILSNLITADAFEAITRDDSHSSDILCSNYPDIITVCAQFKKKDDLSFMYINARSIPKNFDLLTLSLSNLNHTFSTIGISETWLNNENAEKYSIDNFNQSD